MRLLLQNMNPHIKALNYAERVTLTRMQMMSNMGGGGGWGGEGGTINTLFEKDFHIS